MKRPESDISLRLLAVERGKPSPYAKVEVAIAGETICIRWGIDEFTYPHLKRAFQTRCFDTMPGVQYEYFLRLSYGGDGSNVWGFLECHCGSQSTAVEFRCSKYFISNVEWFRSHSVDSVSQLADVHWDLNSPPNPALNRSAQERRSWVPAALRASAPGYAAR